MDVGFFKHLDDIAAVLLDLISVSVFAIFHVIADGLDDCEIRSPYNNITGLLQLMAKEMFGNVN